MAKAAVAKTKKKASLGKLVADVIKSKKLGGEVYSPNYLMGIDILDYLNGRIEYDEKVLGIAGGKIVSIVGKSGSGKSTLAYQLAGMILRTDENAQIIHLDYERAGNKARIGKMVGVDPEFISAVSESYTFLNSDISSESLYNLVKAIYDIKKDNAADYTIEAVVGGKKVSYFVPTVILVDSLATMIPKTLIDEKELSGSMSAASIAKTNNSIYKRLSNFITDANITVVNINHITQAIAMGPGSTKPALNFLAQGESLPGGTSAIFLTDSLLKLDASSKLEEDKDFGIKGFMVYANFIKSRSNSSGRKVTLVFDQERGFDNFLTNLQYLKMQNLLQGSGHGYYIETMPDAKFKMKNAREFYESNAEFKAGFDSYMVMLYERFLSPSNEEAEEEAFALVENVKDNIWIANDGKTYSYNEETDECTEVEVQ